jgi:hypothetical protein
LAFTVVAPTDAEGEDAMVITAAEMQPRCVAPGEPVILTLSIAELTQAVVGYQAFVAFDPDALSFVAGSYLSPSYFGLPLVYPIAATPEGMIAVSAGTLPWDDPVSEAVDLARLEFVAGDAEAVVRVVFVPHDPPNKLIRADDEPVFPMLWGSPPVAVTSGSGGGDADGDGVPDGCDLCQGHDDLQDADGDGFPDACDRFGDLDHDADVDLTDLVGLTACRSGPGMLPTPPPPLGWWDCVEVFDAESDFDVDLVDLAEFQASFAPADGRTGVPITSLPSGNSTCR